MANAESKLNSSIDQLWFFKEENRKLLFLFIKTFVRDFLLAWLARGGVGFLPHLLRLFRAKRFNVLEALVHSFGITATRFGLSMALYFAIFKISEKIIGHFRKRRDSWNAFIAGAFASISLIFEDESTRWILAQYLFVRALGCAWANFQNRYPKLNKVSKFGDSLIFAICSGQAVYNFIVRPNTVDPAYNTFLTQVAQLDPLLIDLFRGRLETGKLDPAILSKLIISAGKKGIDIRPAIQKMGNDISCQIVHPGRICIDRILWVWMANFKMVFPMYFSLHIIPPLLFKFKSSIEKLRITLENAVRNGAQSSSFMATYVFIFQIIFCSQRKLVEKRWLGEWKYAYWWMGFISAFSIFLEKKSRRSELVLYMLPRAGVSLYRAMVQKKLAINLPLGEFAMFATAMAVIMKTYRKDQQSLSPIVSRILKQFL